MKSYILLDFDGVIVDSMPYWETLGADFLRAEGKKPEEGFRQIIRPMTMEESAVYFQEKYGIKGSVSEIIDRVMSHMEQNYLTKIPLKDGVIEAFKKWKIENRRMAIVTASEEEIVWRVLERFHLRSYIEFVLTCTSVHKTKRESEIYQIAAKRFGVETEETILFDDDLEALKAAKHAGAEIVGMQDESNYDMAEEIQKISGCYQEKL